MGGTHQTTRYSTLCGWQLVPEDSFQLTAGHYSALESARLSFSGVGRAGVEMKSVATLVAVCLFLAFGNGLKCIGTPSQKTTVKTDSLDVHAEASASSKTVKSLAKGETVSVSYELVGAGGTWCAIVEEGKSRTSGYVLCQHLERNTSSRAWRSTGFRTSGAAPRSAPLERTVASRPSATRPASQVTALLYLASWCPYCRKARECLRSMGVNLIEYDIEKDTAKAEEMKRKGGTGGIPFIDIEGIHIEGYGEGAIRRAVAQRQAP